MAFSEVQQQLLGPQAFAIAQAVQEVILGEAVQAPDYAATVTTTVTHRDTRVFVGTLTGNITIGAPVGARRGMRLTYSFTQDGTGGRTVTWNAAFKTPANGAGGANGKGAVSFVYDGTNWVIENGALAFNV